MLIDLATHGLLTNRIDPSSVIVDLGANEGSFAKAALARFECRVVAVEPSKAHAELLATLPYVRVIRAAVSDYDGLTNFHVNDNSQMSSIRPLSGEAYGRTEQVEVLSYSSLIARTGLSRIDVLKIDIEGSEVGLLNGMSDSQLKEIAQVTIELHDFNGMISVSEADQIDARFSDLGFHRIQLSRTNRENVLFFQPSRCGTNLLSEAWARHITRNWIGFRRLQDRRRSTRPETTDKTVRAAGT